MTELEALVTLNQIPKVGPITIRALIDSFGSALDALSASLSQIQEVKYCQGSVGERIANWKSITNTGKEIEECEKHDIQIITPNSMHWPSGLSDLKDEPVLLYVKGTLEAQDNQAVAIIGSRKTTNYGRVVTSKITKELASSGHPIISGLALGIDTIAHTSALEIGQRTIAVLGSGLGHLYPKQNQKLATEITENGAVVSEYPLFTHPDRQTFPQRNRIVAAWAKATLVTEMPKKSGAMITTNYARNLSREVFAVPGPIDRPSSEGCHLLINQGATLTTHGSQVSQALSPAPTQLDFDLEAIQLTQSPQPTLTTVELKLYNCLNSLEQTVEELHIETEIPIQELTTALMSLELQDLAQQHAGMSYTRIK